MRNEIKPNPPEGPRLVRVLRGFTQIEVAALAGVDQSAVSRLERQLPVSETSRRKIEAVLAPGASK